MTLTQEQIAQIELHDALERLHGFCNGNAKRAYSTMEGNARRTAFLEVMEQIGDEWSRAAIAAMPRREGGVT